MSAATPDDHFGVEARFGARGLADPAALAAIRVEFADWLSSLPGIAERLDEMLVVFSELGANAVEASPPDGPPATVAAWRSGNQLAIEVVNDVGGSPTDSSWDLDDPLRTGGRGLMLVSAFTDEVDVTADGNTVRVRCVTELAPSSG